MNERIFPCLNIQQIIQIQKAATSRNKMQCRLRFSLFDIFKFKLSTTHKALRTWGFNISKSKFNFHIFLSNIFTIRLFIHIDLNGILRGGRYIHGNKTCFMTVFNFCQNTKIYSKNGLVKFQKMK